MTEISRRLHGICSYNYLLADENTYNAHINVAVQKLFNIFKSSIRNAFSIGTTIVQLSSFFSYGRIITSSTNIGNVFMFHSDITEKQPMSKIKQKEIANSPRRGIEPRSPA